MHYDVSISLALQCWQETWSANKYSVNVHVNKLDNLLIFLNFAAIFVLFSSFGWRLNHVSGVPKATALQWQKWNLYHDTDNGLGFYHTCNSVSNMEFNGGMDIIVAAMSYSTGSAANKCIGIMDLALSLWLQHVLALSLLCQQQIIAVKYRTLYYVCCDSCASSGVMMAVPVEMPVWAVMVFCQDLHWCFDSIGRNDTNISNSAGCDANANNDAVMLTIVSQKC